jgi:hypothetical protein
MASTVQGMVLYKGLSSVIALFLKECRRLKPEFLLAVPVPLLELLRELEKEQY